jgi:hypothetical protein
MANVLMLCLFFVSVLKDCQVRKGSSNGYIVQRQLSVAN